MQDNDEAKSLNLLPVHLADLRASGLTDETIREHGIRTERDHQRIARDIGRPYPKLRGDAMAFPFLTTDGTFNCFVRYKPCFPKNDRNGRPVKYISPKGAGNRAYFPRGTLAVLNDSTRELLVVEGEKKSLCATQEGFPAVGLIGVYGWKDGKKADRLIAELDAIEWRGRKVFIGYDSDLMDKPEVKAARARLAQQLTARGADVRCIDMPDEPDGSKNGIDDYLVRYGRVALRKLMDTAAKPEPPDDDSGKIKASDLDSVPEARKFLELHCTSGELTTLIHHRGSFYNWQGPAYREILPDEFRSKMYVYLDRFAFDLKEANISNVTGAVKALTHLRADLEIPRWLDGSHAGRDFISLKNGILDVAAWLRGDPAPLLPHSPLWFSTVSLPYEFDPAAECPLWLKTLDINMDGDEQRKLLLQEITGNCLVIDTSHQKYAMLHGEGGNGKSVFCAGFTAILGCDNVSHLALESFGQRFQLWTTYGKLANVSTEIGELDRIAEGTLKMFVSGDRLMFERKYADPVNAIPTARLIVSTNNLPRFNDRSAGVYRRTLLIPFNHKVGESERIPNLDKHEFWEASGELPGMLNWSLAGLRRLREQKHFTRSDVCEMELAKYRADCNPAALFFAETCTADPQGDVVTQDVYRRYVTWCEANGFRSLASNTFGREIIRAFPQATQGKVWNSDGKRTEGYRGVKLNDELGNYSDNPDSKP